MSRIDELIAEHSPGGVDIAMLGDIAHLLRGNGMPRTDLTNDGVGAIHYGQIYTQYGAWTTSTISFVAPETATKLAEAAPGDVIITNTSENIKDVGKAVAWLGNDPIVTGGHATVIKHGQNPKYLSYWFQSESFSAQKRALASGTKVIDVSAKQLAKVRVPVPPLVVQQEIVRVLDEFTQLEAELEAELGAELEARRRQYEYYRGVLVDFSGTMSRRVRLDELLDLRAGKFISAADIAPEPDPEHSVPCFGGGGLRGYVSSPNRQGDSLLIGRQGALCGNVKRARGEFYATEHSVVGTPKAGVDIKWAFHLLAHMNLNQYASKSAQPGLAVGTLNQLVVHVPSLDDQSRVGSILDKFDVLVNDLSIGLPAEIAARRKQYEYYRDKLLAFKEAD